jgi:hypothetical protein
MAGTKVPSVGGLSRPHLVFPGFPMSSQSMSSVSLPPHRQSGWWLGLALAALLAAAGLWLASLPTVQGWGISALTAAILLGIVAGNTVFPRIAARTAPGVDFAKSTLLRLGIVLYGFRVTVQDIAQVGMAGLVIDVIVVASVFLLAVWLGTRLFKLDRETSMLIGAGSAICGAAAQGGGRGGDGGGVRHRGHVPVSGAVSASWHRRARLWRLRRIDHP